MSMVSRKISGLLLVGLLSLTLIKPRGSVEAASFQAGQIIADQVFVANTMSVSTIQTFLNNQNSTCLKSYNTPSIRGNNQYGSNVKAAEAIKQAADLFGVNPQVLLVTLQKENGLVTRGDCPSWRYRTAMGMGCPDGADCDAYYFGFSKQMYHGARHLKGYYLNNGSFGITFVPYTPGTRFIKWHPDCGGSNVNIQTRGTASLYSYTPYQPNAAALAAGYGTGDGCSSYGNRNFWLYFNDWFGSPLGDGDIEGEIRSVFRLYKRSQGIHLYTNGLNERFNAELGGYRYEGVAFAAYYRNAIPNLDPVYRLYNSSSKERFLATSAREIDRLERHGFRNEGVAFYAVKSSSPTKQSVYRLFRGSDDKRFWTTSTSERDKLVRHGFRYEGVAWYAPTNND